MRMYLSVLLSMCLCVLISGCARSDSHDPAQLDATPAATDASRVSTAAEILQTTSRCYAGIQSFRVDIVETMSLDRSGTREVTAGRVAATLARPNRVSLPGADAKGLSFFADGQQLWTVLGDRFSQEPCPATTSLIADDPIRSSLLPLGSLFLLRLLSEDAREAITQDVESVAVLDDELLERQLAHRLQFTQKNYDWEMWVAVDEPRLIYQVVYDMSKQMGVGLSDDEEARITMTIRFKNW
ncbi:MAG: DUF2092 domain-containing protein, partial [Pirellulaceae bacterium]|nr:DUF2092 domain-containing protein [Pirellulaceae bacterium]